MSTCPLCNKPLVLNDPVEYNVLAYGVSKCSCGLVLWGRCSRPARPNIAVSPSFGPDTEDDQLHKVKGKDISCDTQ